MPLYEYACEQCDKEFELLIRSSNDEAACPDCGTKKITKLLSLPAAHTSLSQSLPICKMPRGGGCGLPQCGSGGCMGL